MITINDIYDGAVHFINQFLRAESHAQGHFLTGALEDSLGGTTVKEGDNINLEGFAAYYAQFVNEGVPAAHASMKQFPFMVRYFLQRGLPEREAKGAAAATIHKWMTEGMSTQASKRFSSTGARQHFIESAFTANNSQLDEYMTNSFDFLVDELYMQEKSETI